MFDAVYKHQAVVFAFLMLRMSLRLVGLNIYFYDVFFNYERVYYNEIHIKCAGVIHIILLSGQSLHSTNNCYCF